jgi:hypothetical protein
LCNPRSTLKHPDATVATYKRRHFKHASEKLVKTLENHCKHMQHPDETFATGI